MAMIAIPVSSDISRLFREIEVAGHRDPSDHITLFHLGDSINIDTVLDIIPIIHKVIEDVRPFEATVSKITSFPKGEGKKEYPIIAEIKSEKLMEVREKIRKLLDKNKIEYSKTFDEFKPHITLSFNNKKQKVKLPTKAKFMITQLALYGGDEADSKIFVNFPLSLGTEKSATDRLLELSDSFYKMSVK